MAPLPSGEPKPTDQPVANTTLETYVQDATCLDCHVSAPIAASDYVPTQCTKHSGNTVDYAADYSFLLHHACSPAATGMSTPLTWVAVSAAAAAAGATAAAVRARRRRTAT
jgi:hypothetical protein